MRGSNDIKLLTGKFKRVFTWSFRIFLATLAIFLGVLADNHLNANAQGENYVIELYSGSAEGITALITRESVYGSTSTEQIEPSGNEFKIPKGTPGEKITFEFARSNNLFSKLKFRLTDSQGNVSSEMSSCTMEEMSMVSGAKIILSMPNWSVPTDSTSGKEKYGSNENGYYYYHVYGYIPNGVTLKLLDASTQPNTEKVIDITSADYYDSGSGVLRLPSPGTAGVPGASRYYFFFNDQGESDIGSGCMCIKNGSTDFGTYNPKYKSDDNSENKFCSYIYNGFGRGGLGYFDSVSFMRNDSKEFYAPQKVNINVENFVNCGDTNSIAADNCTLYRRTHMGDFELDKVYKNGKFAGWKDYSYHDWDAIYYMKYKDGSSIASYTGSGSSISKITDVFRIPISNLSSEEVNYTLPVIANKPQLTVNNFDDTDKTQDVRSNYDVTFEPSLTYDSGGSAGQKYKYTLTSANFIIKTKSGSDYKALNKDDFLTSGLTYDNSTGQIALENYAGGDVTIKMDALCTSAFYVGSKTNADSWENESLKNAYSLSVNSTDAKVRDSNNYNKGAWRCSFYDSNITSENFTVSSGLGYEFSGIDVTSPPPSTASISNTSLSADEHGNENKNLAFTSTVPPKSEQIIKIGSQKYTEYTNTFKYSGSAALKDIATMSCGSSDSSVAIGEAENNYRQTWTIASPENFNKYKVVAKSGYALSSETKVKIGDNNPIAYSDDFEVPKAGRANKNLDITIGPLKWVYQVKFTAASESMQGDIEIKREGDVISWNAESGAYELNEGDSFTVDLNITNTRRKYVDNVESIAFGDGITCKKNSDTSITLTIPHGVSTITIPETVYEWRKSSISFVLNTGKIEDDYYSESVDALELYRGDNSETTEENRINLTPSGGDKKMIGGPDKDVAYNKIKYTLKLNDEGGNYVSLKNVKVSVEDKSGEEIKIQGEATDSSVTFYLDSAYAEGVYSGEIKFYIDNIESNLIQIPFHLCAKSLLYKQVGSERQHIATAPNEVGMDKDVGVPGSGETTLIVFYPDYSRIFSKDNIQCTDPETQNPISGITIENTDEFNQVKITINPGNFPESGFPENCKISCDDPARPAPPVTFTPIEGIKYYNVDAQKKIDLNSSIQGVLSIPYGEEFSFAVKNNEGYDLSTLKINKNGAEMQKSEQDGYCVFTISKEDAKVPMTITGSIRPVQCKITFKDSGEFNGCKYFYNGSETNSVTVLYGQGIAFEVSLPNNCNQSEVKVKFGGETLNKIEGKYVINNVTGDGEVTLENLTLNKYPVTFSSNERAYYRTASDGNLSGTINVEHDQSYTFKVKPNAGYRLGEDTVVYLRYANGSQTTLEPDGNGNYKINNIRQACTVSVENVDDLIYTIKLEPVLGVTYLNEVDNVIKDSVKIRYGRNFEFSVVLDDTYDDSYAGMNIMVNEGKSAKSSAQKLASGRYVIPNVTEDMTIKVGNIKKNCYTVTLTGQEGIDYYNSSGKVITGDNQVEHHSDFEFKVELYPAYAGSNITVMLGDTPMTPDGNGYYKIPKVSESKTVTVVGVEQSDETELINKINNLPDNLNNLGDVDDVIAATKMYESLPDSAKALIGNADKLRALQEQVKAFHHVSNDVKIEGVDWNIKLYAIPITDDVEACGRIYKKLNAEYILSLYNVYLWDTLTDTRYELPEGKTAVITLPTPDMKYFEKPTAIHERASGKVEFINLSINGNVSVFQTDSFSPMGIVANRSSTPGRSSLLDAADANADAISRFAAEAFGNNGGTISRSSDSDNGEGISGSSGESDIESDNMSGNIDEKFRSRNNKVNAMSSALRLILVLMVLALIGTIIYLLINRKKDNSESEK